MRNMMRAAMVAMMLMSAGVARAQLIDPSTGVMVDAASDPTDFAAVASGQPGNVGLELTSQAVEQANAMAQQMAQTAQDTTNAAMQSDDTADAGDAGPAFVPPALTQKPVITLNGGKVAAGSSVTIADNDAKALIFYTTDGSAPTAGSAKYAGPIAVHGSVKVRAMAFDVNDMPSKVATKSFKVKH